MNNIVENFIRTIDNYKPVKIKINGMKRNMRWVKDTDDIIPPNAYYVIHDDLESAVWQGAIVANKSICLSRQLFVRTTVGLISTFKEHSKYRLYVVPEVTGMTDHTMSDSFYLKLKDLLNEVYTQKRKWVDLKHLFKYMTFKYDTRLYTLNYNFDTNLIEVFSLSISRVVLRIDGISETLPEHYKFYIPEKPTLKNKDEYKLITAE